MYKLSHLAAEDFSGIYEYTLLNFGVRQADKFTDDMETSLERLANSPLLGRHIPEIGPEIRRLDHDRHAIFYRVREGDIFIVRILHQQMAPLMHFDSL